MSACVSRPSTEDSEMTNLRHRPSPRNESGRDRVHQDLPCGFDSPFEVYRPLTSVNIPSKVRRGFDELCCIGLRTRSLGHRNTTRVYFRQDSIWGQQGPSRHGIRRRKVAGAYSRRGKRRTRSETIVGDHSMHAAGQFGFRAVRSGQAAGNVPRLA